MACHYLNLLFLAFLCSSVKSLHIPGTYRVPLVRNSFDKKLTLDSFVHLHKARYFGVLQLGEPPQSFKMVFDTTTPDVWMPSVNCMDPACLAHNRYNSSASKSYEKDGAIAEVFFMSGIVSGVYSRDFVQLASLGALSQRFAEILNAKIPALQDAVFDGVVGMNLGRNGNIGETLFGNLVSQSPIKPVFSFYFNRNSPVEANQQSELILGGGDPEHYVGPFTYVDVLPGSNLFQIYIDVIRVGSIDVCTLNCRAIMASGDYVVSGPTEQVAIINQAMGGITVNGKEYLLDCSYVPLLPNITFWFLDQKFELTPKDFVVQYDDVCLSGLVGVDGKDWYLGEIFMSRYYTEFDAGKRRVGFALAA